LQDDQKIPGVIPAEAGIHFGFEIRNKIKMCSGSPLRGVRIDAIVIMLP
jgi:hypothetical protein